MEDAGYGIFEEKVGVLSFYIKIVLTWFSSHWVLFFVAIALVNNAARESVMISFCCTVRDSGVCNLSSVSGPWLNLILKIADSPRLNSLA